jgi:hypothetical protein
MSLPSGMVNRASVQRDRPGQLAAVGLRSRPPPNLARPRHQGGRHAGYTLCTHQARVGCPKSRPKANCGSYRRYASLDLDLADAVNVALAAQYRSDAVLTLDRRDFRAIRPLTPHKRFRILPDDL